MRNWGLGGGLAGAGGTAADEPASRDALRSTQSSNSTYPPGALFERGEFAQSLFDIGCAVIWILLGCLGIVGTVMAFAVPFLIYHG